MKYFGMSLVGVFLLSGVGCSDRPTVEIAGVWYVEWHALGETDRERLYPFVMHLTQKGGRLSGSAVAEQKPKPIAVTGILGANSIKFTLSSERGKIDFTGTVEQEKLNGTWVCHGQSGTWTAERNKPDKPIPIPRGENNIFKSRGEPDPYEQEQERIKHKTLIDDRTGDQ